ncbi:hypothetical protein ACFW04_013849 [Cataglyphis niger]
MVLYCTELQSLAKKIRKCREIEEISQFQQFTPQDEQCETHFQIDDRYIVRLPFKQNPPLDIRQSRLTAEHLFNSEFMHVYEALGHMRRVSDNQKSQNQSIYVRHHPIFREESVTTRLRVASSITSNGSSLNNHYCSVRNYKLICTRLSYSGGILSLFMLPI